MTHAIGMLDFFVLEAGEYLERLDGLAQAPAGGAWPGAEDYVRVARAFRGGALMAGQRAIARAAQGLELAGRAVRDGRIAWDERVRGEVIRAVDDCKVLVRRVRTPAPDDAARADALAETLAGLAGRAAPPARGPDAGLDAGGRAFVAREAAAIGSTLDEVARELAADPSRRTALGGVAPAMSALRGVAVLADLPPLPDLLVAVEGIVRETLATAGAVGPDVPALFDAGAQALARAAREVVDLGRPAADGEALAAFTALLLTAFGQDRGVVEMADLRYDADATPVVRAGAPPAPLTRTEVVSEGEYLAAAAAGLQHAASAVVRDLRLFGLAATLRPLAGADGSPLAAALGRLAESARAAIDRGAAGPNATVFGALVAGAADVLRSADAGDEAAAAAHLDGVCARLDALERAAETVAPAQAAAGEAEGLAAPAGAGAPAEGSDLADAFTAFERLSTAGGLAAPPIEALLAGGAPFAAEPALEFLAADEEPSGVVPIEALAPDEDVVPIEALAPDEAPVAVAAAAPEDEDVVGIETLLYGGAAALRRALELQPRIEARLATEGPDAPGVAALLQEVFDLIQLGIGTAR